MEKVRELLAALAFISTAFLLLYMTGNLEVVMSLFLNPGYLKEVLEPYGIFAAFILIGLLLVQNIIWIIPGYGLGVAGGFIFGPITGTLVVFTGTLLSTVLAIFISKWYGRPAVKWILGEEKLERYDHFTESTDVWPFVLMVIVPTIPDDAVAYMAGLSNLKKKKLIFWVALARLPGVIALTWFGDGVATTNYPMIISMSTAIIALVAVSIWKKDEIMKFVHRNRED